MVPSLRSLLPLAALAGLAAAPATAAEEAAAPLAIYASKILTCAEQGPVVVDHGVVLVRDGKIEAVGRRDELEVPADYAVVDVGDQWLMPGMIDLHSHIAGDFDINDTVYLAGPEMRARCSVVPRSANLLKACSAGVTSILFIPGSGVNMGGQGVLLKTALDDYEAMEIRQPGSLKLAQSGNPERWLIGVNRSFMNWNTRTTFQRGLAYAKLWEDYHAGTGPKPEVDPQWELFRQLASGEVQVSTHTQIYQVVQETLLMVKKELGLDVFIDHGTIGAWRLGGLAEELGVAAILGPRNVDTPVSYFMNWAGHIEAEGWRGVVAGYQQMGHKNFGFNTDAPVIPQEELALQAGIAVRYGLEDTTMETVRGLTIVPARTMGIADRIGSLEPGKDADILVVTGHIADPRTSVERVWIEGRQVYSAAERREF